MFFHEFLKSTAKPLGEIADYAIRIEFQARGSPHAHCVIWVKDAPEYGVDHDSQVCVTSLISMSHVSFLTRMAN